MTPDETVSDGRTDGSLYSTGECYLDLNKRPHVGIKHSLSRLKSEEENSYKDRMKNR
jgi:hypothetical protein